MNSSKMNDPRFWNTWRNAGAVSNINAAVPTDQHLETMAQLSSWATRFGDDLAAGKSTVSGRNGRKLQVKKLYVASIDRLCELAHRFYSGGKNAEYAAAA